MSERQIPRTSSPPIPPARPADEASLGELVTRMQEQTARLIHDELRLARAEMTAKGKRAGLGLGLFGGAGVFALYGIGALVAAAVLGLGIPLDGWLAALIVAAALFAAAGIAALVGKNEVGQATPPMPRRTVQSISDDVAAIKPGSEA